MDEIKEALKVLVLKLLATISRSEWWITVITIVLAGLVALQQGADKLQVIIAILSAITGGSVYTIYRTKRKVSEDNVRIDTMEFKELQKVNEEAVPDTEGLWVFDVAGFHMENEKTVQAAYGIVNPATLFYNSERLARNIDAGSWENAQIYWEYNSQLAKDAYIFVHGEDIEKCKEKILSQKPTCSGWDLASHCKTQGMEHYVALLKLQRAEENYANVLGLSSACDFDIYMAGEMARYY